MALIDKQALTEVKKNQILAKHVVRIPWNWDKVNIC